MNLILLQSVKTCLEAYSAPGRPVLLAYSGGPDSKALLYLLLECKKLLPIDLHLAHVDHQWRAESGQEAERLRGEAEELGLTFHLHQLPQEGSPKRNLEAEGRRARLAFFKTVYEQIGAQALCLGHHADDLAETVLKRVFEGAHFRHVGGLNVIGEYEGMALWRPLLEFRKAELLQWLDHKGLQGFVDVTNTDPRFLRSRMRTDLLPLLSKTFGKEISGNLCRLSRMAHELSAYFSSKLQGYLSEVKTDPEGVHWDLSSYHLERVEWDYLLKEWSDRQGCLLSAEMLKQIALSLRNKKANCQLELKQGTLFLDRGCLFLRYKQSLKR